MKTPQTKQDLEDLIRDKIEENFALEYKDGRALSDTKEIAKDVSAMANSAGGLVIYGISEKDHFPEKITPIDRNEFSKERLEQIITSNISPRINELKIIPISVGGGAVYVVEILQSTTVHQNTKDQKYYKRRNFKSEPMLDYEIRDVMNRAKHPKVELGFEVEKKTNTELFLKIIPLNKGENCAQFVNYFVELPANILTANAQRDLKKLPGNVVEYYGENTVMHSASSRFDPILPKLRGRSEVVQLITNLAFDDREIKWRVHADNAPIQTGSIALNKIFFVENEVN